MKIRTLILMAIVVILAGCSGSILQGSTDANFPEKFRNTTWIGEGYSATFSSTGYTIVVGDNEGRITNTSRYKGKSISIKISEDENTVEIEVNRNYPEPGEDPTICTDIFSITGDGSTLGITMLNVSLDGSREIWRDVFDVDLLKN